MTDTQTSSRTGRPTSKTAGRHIIISRTATDVTERWEDGSRGQAGRMTDRPIDGRLG